MVRSSKKSSANQNGVLKSDQILLKKVGLRIHRDLFERGETAEWLAFSSGLARSSVREIIAGRSNFRFLTMAAIARTLGYRNLVEFLNQLDS